MAGWFVGPIMDKIINTGFDYLKDQIIWQTGMKDALERLQRLHPKIQSVIDYAYSQAQIIDQNQALNRWLWQLRDAIDEADDLLDEFEYMKLKQQLMAGNMEETKKRKLSSITSFLFESARKILKVGERALKIDPNLKRLAEVVRDLDKVSADVGNFLHLLESTKQEQQEQQLELYKTRETGSLPKNDQIGRDKEKEFVMQWLIRKPSNEHQTNIITATTLFGNISLLSIVGHGGMGKTTLLQHAYEDEILTKEFDLRMWVCVSNDFDVKRVIADMLESLKKERPRLESLHTLQESLKSKVMSKKFLLVLDDIWEEEEERDKSKWENVLAPLAYGSLGSKILVTTRMDSVASMIAKVMKKKKETLRLEGLEEDECLLLLNSHAFIDVENPHDHEKLRSIAEKIVKKLSGSPLAAKVLGGVLNSSLDERHWIRVLNNDIGSAENDILPILRLSYTYLSKPVRSCFAFCCIFPQDHEFDKHDLVQMWIALGFIQSSYNGGETMEDIGGRYFDVLVKKSFFDEFRDRVQSYYKMHDLLHELAQSVSSKECFRGMGDDELFFKASESIRHLSVKTNNLELLKKMGNFKNLRSLFLTYDEVNQDFVDVLNEMFKASRSIRLLYIYSPCLKLIPEVIGYLIHLRYLKIYSTEITQLPRSLNILYHLQFLIFGGYINENCPYDFLPSDINNLSNLQYLELPWDDFPGIYGIGKLKSLQTLNGFYVKNETGYRIGELEHMNDLHQLRIKFIENVKDVEEACSAKLCHKRNLADLSLEWGDVRVSVAKPKCYEKKGISLNIADPKLDEKVLDNLEPHNSLKKLRIYSFMGTRSAIWMNNANLISNLEYIQVDECFEWQTLPPFGQLPYLKSLYLRDMPKVKRLDNKFHGNDKDCVFSSLEVLFINKLEALENWFDATAAASDCLFPRLTILYLKDCPNLKELPSLPPKLKNLEIDNIGWKAFNWFQGTRNCCIEELAIKGNDELVSLPIEAEQWFLQVSSSLCKLIFERLKSLQSLPSSLESLSSLKILFVREAPRLQLLPNIPTSLERLKLVKLESLQCLPFSLWKISSLKYLHLLSIPLLKSLPNLPPSLCVLDLRDLENLTSLHPFVIENGPQLRELPYLPSSLIELKLTRLKSLQSLPSSLISLSSLKTLYVESVPQLQLLPNIPASLEHLGLKKLNLLQFLPSSMSTISSLKYLVLKGIPLLKSLPDLPSSLEQLELEKLESLQCLPSSMSTISSLEYINLLSIPLLKSLPDLPSSLKRLKLEKLESLECLPSSMSTISSLNDFHLIRIPLLKSLPDLPPSLCTLHLYQLENLDCLPSFLPSLSSLQELHISKVPQLQELPDLPPSLKFLFIHRCHQELMERYEKSSGTDWHKIAHILRVDISNTDDQLDKMNENDIIMIT